MKEPLLERLYWHSTFPRGPTSKAESKRLVGSATDDELVDVQVILAKVRIAATRAAKRRFGYPDHETGSEEEVLTEMIEKAGDCPLTIVFHAYERMLFAYR